MKKYGFYIIKDEFYELVEDKNLKSNKSENRPHYFCLEYKNFYWMIPISSQVEKYKKIINDKLRSGKKCDILHVAKLDDGNETAFLIQDVFPITERYVEREFVKFGKHFMISSEALIKEIEKKAKTIINMSMRGVKFLPTQVDINMIIKKLDAKNR